MSEKFEEYLNKKVKLTESVDIFKSNCYLLTNNKEIERNSEKRKGACEKAKLELSKIYEIARDMAIEYSDKNNYKLKEKVKREFGNYFQSVVSNFPNKNKGADCYRGNCGETPGSIINLWRTLKKTEDGSKITSPNGERISKIDNVEKWIL